MLEVSVTRPLRDYQQLCIEHTLKSANQGSYYTLPTGTGKTRIATGLVEHYAQEGRVLVVAHRKELIEQMAQAIREDIPDSDVGVCMADQNEWTRRIIVGSVQTLREDRLRRFLVHANLWNFECDRVSALLIDECHHVTPSNSYKTLIDAVLAVYPPCKVIGCTATPYRSDKSSMLDVLSTCTFSRTIADMQEAGWLCPLTWQRLQLPASFSGLKTSSISGEKDYNQEQLEALVSPYTPYIVRETAGLLEDRPTVVFAVSVKHAQELAGAYMDADIPALAIWGDMPKVQREIALKLWKCGDCQIVVNVGILTEGFDYVPSGNNPHGLSAIVQAAPTMSPALYMQKLGRGTRLKPFASVYQDCLVVDVCGNANLLETKQITLPRCMPTMPEEGPNGQHIYTGKREHTSRPVSLRINDPVSVSWCAWGYNYETGIFYTGLDNDIYAWLAPEKESGLWKGYVSHKAGNWTIVEWFHSCITVQPKPLQEIMQHMNHIIAQNGKKILVDKNALWRQVPPSEAQLNYLHRLSHRDYWLAINGGWTKGEVGHALTWHTIKGEIGKICTQI